MRDATIKNVANDPNVIVVLLLARVPGLVIPLPLLYYLFSLFMQPYPVSGMRYGAKQKMDM